MNIDKNEAIDAINQPIHVHHVVLSLEPGGLENGVINIINGLDPTQFKSSVCCLKTKGEFAGRIKSSDVSVKSMDMTKGEDYWMIMRLVKLFRSTKTDIIHTRNQKSYFYGYVAGKLAGVKAIIHSEHGRNFPGKRHRMFLQSLLSRNTDAVVAMSDDLRIQLDRYVPIPYDKIDVIYNGVSTERFRFAVTADGRTTARRALDISPDEFVVGSIGRLASVKNFPLLLAATAKIKDKHRVKLLLVGGGPDEENLKKIAEELGIGDICKFLGYREDVEKILPAYDAFVLPSFSEGVSNTLLEAMASGVPVIASAVGGNVEIIEDQVTGFLFNSNDELALETCLLKLIGDPGLSSSLVTNAQKVIEERFGMSRMIEEYSSLYNEVYRRKYMK